MITLNPRTSGRIIESVSNSWIKSSAILSGAVLFSAFAVATTLYSDVVQACEGAELQKTIQIIQRMQQDGVTIGYQCGFNANPLGCMLQAMSALNEKYTPVVGALKPSCQQLIASVGRSTGDGPGGTQCVGSVCCDNTGCY